MTADPDLIAVVREAFGLPEPVVVTPGPRGAAGQVWRLDAGPAAYALKEHFGDPPAAAVIAAELRFARAAAAEGVRLPASRPDRRGRHLVAAPGGGWLRLHDWVDLTAAPVTPAVLGDLLARLHRCGTPLPTEPSGGPPDPWYHRCPAAADWAAARAAPEPWARRLDDLLATVPQLCAAVTPPEAGALILCHRDLHPENVLTDATGAAVVVDFDDIGPAVPARELARALFDWFCDSRSVDRRAVLTTYRSYRDGGGPARITGPADFSMLIASRLNFLLRQTAVAADPLAEPRHRDWARREIAEAVAIFPAPGRLSEVLELVG